MLFAKVSELLTNGERGVLVTVLHSTPLFQPLRGTHWIWRKGRLEWADAPDEMDHLGEIGRAGQDGQGADSETVLVEDADFIEIIAEIIDADAGEIEQVGEKDGKYHLGESSRAQLLSQKLTQVCQQVLKDGQFRRQKVELDDQWLDLTLEPILPKSRLVILGAGHVGQALAKLADLAELPVVIVDDRPDFANQHLYLEGVQVICDGFLRVIDQLQLTENDYLVIVTRGHQYDRNCLLKVAGMDLAYVGMIGSRRRVKGLFAELEKQGIDPEWLARVHSPIGLDIGAETPQEIGVSILAELIKVRRKGA